LLNNWKQISNKYVQPLVSAPMLYNADWLAWNTRWSFSGWRTYIRGV